MGAPTPPKPQTPIFDATHELLGTISGAVRVEVADDVIWAVGGMGNVAYRCAEGVWATHALQEIPNFIIALSATSAVVGCQAGWVGRTHDAGASWSWEQAGASGGWMICGSRDRSGQIWIGQQNGAVWRAADARAPLEQTAQIRGSVGAIKQISDEHALVVGPHTVHRLVLATGTLARAPLFTERTLSMIDGAVDDRGRIVVVANRGGAWCAEPGRKFARVETGIPVEVAFDAVFWIAPWFTALAYDGALRVSLDGVTWKKVAVASNRTTHRLGGIAAYRGGWLVGIEHRDDGRGALVYLGDPAAAPLAPMAAPTDPEAIAALSFVLAERYALLWAGAWAALPRAEEHAVAWMALAKQRA